jgi:diguanylate cyclase (GGDEF)-like protein
LAWTQSFTARSIIRLTASRSALRGLKPIYFFQGGASGLAKNEIDAGGARSLKGVLGRLEELKHTPLGTVIYEQISRILTEYETVQSKVDQAYGVLLHVLLDSYASNPTTEHVTELNAKLIRAHMLSSANSEANVSVPPSTGAAAAPSKNAVTDRAESINQSLERLRRTAASAVSPPIEPPPQNQTGAVAPAKIAAEPRENNNLSNDRRIHSAYRLHLDRKRNEIDRLQRALSQNVVETINQNREFGAMLKIELEALQHAENGREIEKLRQILIGGIEELIQGQRSLDTKLHKTSDYLKIVETDSQHLREELSKVRHLSLTDEFTGLANRRAFIRNLQDEIGRSQRYGTHLSLALIDVDEFKSINDLHGHAAGDTVLRCYATHVLSILRHYDLVARYGGEEFAVLLPNTQSEGAVSAINKVKSRALEVSCEYDGKVLNLPTFSAGVTVYSSGDTQDSLIARADRALYRAKRLGRNRVEVEISETRDQGEAEPVHSNEG